MQIKIIEWDLKPIPGLDFEFIVVSMLCLSGIKNIDQVVEFIDCTNSQGLIEMIIQTGAEYI
jgi:hypothetical protein